ncbi:HesA/MoeB/ThiF family protein [Desulfosudis oleivorans]|uniref:UBA/THIF-type NAD/FAD binding protein n=1 Tax=Desulfosudis oleivorans (strain DSM 6200 / JCM 39069 / Hxd3) TaxID=96561 RepID=A8ZW74_DESOH|nr:HesA/MoeB/ThiF family protein [Desulfosudis oleivorans]ABW68308.1 UBA/THIF-type NAD/FAD binding protein [Desulfosudis oleivorans Hxd3]
MTPVKTLIENKSFQKEDHRGCRVTCIRESDLLEISISHGLSMREVTITCMVQGVTPLRYLRNAPSINPNEQITLARSCVSVAGAGGLGGHVITLLARLGIGEIRVFDPDDFDETNMNRQTFCTTETLGKNKALAAAAACRAINPAVDVNPHPTAVKSPDHISQMTGSQVIIDALDNARDRHALADIARSLDIPMIHGAVAGFEGRVMTVLPENTSFAHLFPPEQNASPQPVFAEQVLGTPALSPAFIAPLQVMAALHILLKRDTTLTDQLIHADLQTPSLNIFTF